MGYVGQWVLDPANSQKTEFDFWMSIIGHLLFCAVQKTSYFLYPQVTKPLHSTIPSISPFYVWLLTEVSSPGYWNGSTELAIYQGKTWETGSQAKHLPGMLSGSSQPCDSLQVWLVRYASLRRGEEVGFSKGPARPNFLEKNSLSIKHILNNTKVHSDP